MGYKSNAQDENPLWRNYMDNVNDDIQWMEEIDLNLSVPSTTYRTYSEEDFEQMLASDVQFNEKWGTIKNP